MCLASLLLAGCGRSEFPLRFPKDFLWGTAGSAYQQEGTSDPVLGTVASNWQEWEAQGRIQGGQRNDAGVGFQARYADDFALAHDLGNNAVRVGVEWARIQPTPDRWNAQAVAHYRQVLQAARAQGLEPVVTLYHWVVPTWVQSPSAKVDLLSEAPTVVAREGTTVLESRWADAFAAFAGRLSGELGDLVDTWVILNEPYTVLGAGYLTGAHPNGRFVDLEGMRNAGLNFIIGYAAGYDAVHANDRVDANGDGVAVRAGLAAVGTTAYPRDPARPDDEEAAKRLNYLINDWMMNAWTTGALDVDVDGKLTGLVNPVPEGTYAAQLANRLDYVGVNFYAPVRAQHCPGLWNLASSEPGKALARTVGAVPVVELPRGVPVSQNGLEVYAPALRDTLKRFAVWASADRPIYILENGHGDCQDGQRRRYLAEHLYYVGLAVREGLPLRGYMLWSLTDNFEWEAGRNYCFGLYQVDDARGQARVPTKSVEFYRQVIAKGLEASAYQAAVAEPYPTGCNALVDAGQRAQCLAALPKREGAGLQQILDSVCKGP